MKRLLTHGWLLAALTGLLFVAYSAYNVFIIFRDINTLSPEGILISGVVALMFAVFAAFMWTAGIKGKKHVLFMKVRRVVFIIALAVVFVLKMRLTDRMIVYLDFTKLYTVLYVASFFLTPVAFLFLLVYYTFILKKLPFYPRARVLLPVIAAVLFFCSLVLEAILFLVYGFYTEANALRTAVIRPVFYMGFIGLSLHFLYPIRTTK